MRPHHCKIIAGTLKAICSWRVDGMAASSRMNRTHHVGALKKIVVDPLLWINTGVVPELETQHTVDEAVV